MFIVDQCLHYTTINVQIDPATAVDTPNLFGRGRTSEYLSMSREPNYWELSIMDFSLHTFQYKATQNQTFLLQQGMSNVSSGKLVKKSPQLQNHMALLVAADLLPRTDYCASTVGVSAQCVPISSKCEMRKTGTAWSYTSFNCSEKFWGFLNKSAATINKLSFVDPDVPPLAFKWAKNLQ